ncbi:hypothetical protein [Azospirillum picis]|uniref:Replicative helicase inhibitor G39P N-terminal domain-containing protein n=1 Tax=Azospirillum picis TaxID=488438 RepID=A0ABU0MPX4_9PROT|nr:hypothetical protein [Azospirillum picis]MBP2301552.1 hypothetical protein [Azospirillum picis]MDQ0535384.1 hypothetical protein [Azospirillum picis]
MPVPLEAVHQAVASVEAMLIPADPRAIAVELEKTLALFGAPDNWDDIADVYLETFEDVPLDLVRQACKAARLRCKWFPKPAELLAPISEELSRRRHCLRRLGAAAMKAKPAERVDSVPLATEEQKAAVAEMVAKITGGTSGRKPALVDSPADEQAEDHRDVVRRVMAETKGFRRIPKPGERREGEVAL